MNDIWLEFAKVAAAHAVAVVSPGPDFAIVLRQSIAYGRRTGTWTSIGVGTAILLHVTYSVLGIALLIKGAPWFSALRYAGAAYIGWLGLQSLRVKRSAPQSAIPSIKTDPPTAAMAFRTGFLTNALNPKVTLFFVSLFAAVINPATPKVIQAGYGVWMSVTTMAWFCLVAAFFTQDRVQVAFERYGHWVSRALGVFLLAFAVALAIGPS